MERQCLSKPVLGHLGQDWWSLSSRMRNDFSADVRLDSTGLLTPGTKRTACRPDPRILIPRVARSTQSRNASE